MPTKYGSAYSDTDPLKKAPGTSVNAGARHFRNVFNFADAGVGGTQNPLCVAKLPAGVVPKGFTISSDQNISATNITVGNATTAAKYVTSTAGPAANATKRCDLVIATLAADPSTDTEEVLVTPSANWPAAGTLVVDFIVTKR